jgi:hypothetical protein
MIRFAFKFLGSITGQKVPVRFVGKILVIRSVFSSRTRGLAGHALLAVIKLGLWLRNGCSPAGGHSIEQRDVPGMRLTTTRSAEKVPPSCISSEKADHA